MANDQEFSEAEIKQRADAALRVALNTRPKPHEKMKQRDNKRVAESKKTDSTVANRNGGRRPSKRG